MRTDSANQGGWLDFAHQHPALRADHRLSGACDAGVQVRSEEARGGPCLQRHHHGRARRGELPRAAIQVERSEEHTSELQSHSDLVCRLLLEKKKKNSSRRRAASERTTGG